MLTWQTLAHSFKSILRLGEIVWASDPGVFGPLKWFWLRVSLIVRTPWRFMTQCVSMAFALGSFLNHSPESPVMDSELLWVRAIVTATKRETEYTRCSFLSTTDLLKVQEPHNYWWSFLLLSAVHVFNNTTSLCPAILKQLTEETLQAELCISPHSFRGESPSGDSMKWKLKQTYGWNSSYLDKPASGELDRKFARVSRFSNVHLVWPS